jgi:hypothetical protein
MQNTQKLYCSLYYYAFFKTYRKEGDVGFPYRIPEHPSSLLPNDEQNDHRGTAVHNLEVLDSNLGQVTSLL